MQGAAGLKRILILGACAAALLGALLASAPKAHAITSIPGRIFILSDVAGVRGDLFRTTPSNTWKRLTYGLNYPESISADPNGKFVTLCATKGGGLYRIYRISANGGALKSLIGRSVGCAPTVSSDGRKVAYIQSGATTTNLKVVSSRGGKSRTIYRFCSSCLYNPIWAGKRIYFERRVARNLSADFEIYSVRASDGKGLRRHTFSAAGVDYDLKDALPSGRKILAAVRDSSGAGRNDLVALSPNGVELRTIMIGDPSSNPFGGAAFSPSGIQVAANEAFPTVLNPYEVLISSDIRNPLIVSSGIPNPAVSGGSANDGPYSLDWVTR